MEINSIDSCLQFVIHLAHGVYLRLENRSIFLGLSDNTIHDFILHTGGHFSNHQPFMTAVNACRNWTVSLKTGAD